MLDCVDEKVVESLRDDGADRRRSPRPRRAIRSDSDPASKPGRPAAPAIGNRPRPAACRRTSRRCPAGGLPSRTRSRSPSAQIASSSGAGRSPLRPRAAPAPSASACRGRRSSCRAPFSAVRRRPPRRAAAAHGAPAAAAPRPASRAVGRLGDRASRSVDQAVADAPAVDDEAAVLGVELAPQPAGVRVERPRAAQRAEAPDVAQQLLLGEDPGRVGGERPQQRRTPCWRARPRARRPGPRAAPGR